MDVNEMLKLVFQVTKEKANTVNIGRRLLADADPAEDKGYIFINYNATSGDTNCKVNPP